MPRSIATIVLIFLFFPILMNNAWAAPVLGIVFSGNEYGEYRPCPT
jgi:hypothetical protein